MPIEVEYRGREFLFDEEPSEKELEEAYEARFGSTQIRFPVPSSSPLERAEGPYEARPLADREIVFWSEADSPLAVPIVEQLTQLGARVGVPSEVAGADELGDGAFVLDPADFESLESGRSFDGFLFDGTVLEDVADLDRAHRFFHLGIESLDGCGRVLMLTRPPEAVETEDRAAAQRSLEGFVRGMGKEIGSRGSTANLLVVEEGDAGRLRRPLAYFLSDRAAYVSGQPLRIGTGAEPHPDRGSDEEIFAGKTALVTGGTRGIGRATAERFVDEGAEVVCVGRPGSDALDEIEEEFGGIPCPLDVGSDEAADRIEEVAREHGGFDIVVHNAGIAPHEGSLEDLEYDTWREVLAVNMDGAVRITERLVESDLINDWGRVLCTSSVNGTAGGDRFGYAASKAGLIGLVHHCARALGDRGITGNAVIPGSIETRMSEKMPEHVRTAVQRMNSLYQPGFPSDVADAFVFLASPGAQAISGESLRVCGGYVVGA